MDKYGVETEPKKDEKTAAKKTNTCPRCGASLEDLEETGQHKCPVHGTEPFEK